MIADNVERNSRHHKPRSQSACITPADEDPRSLIRPDLVAAWERKLHVLRKVVEILDSLVKGVYLKALDRQIGVGVR